MLKKLRSPLYLALLVPALLSLGFQFLAPIDHVFWNIRFKFGKHPVAQSTVIVALEGNAAGQDSAIRTARLAKVLEHVRRQMPYRVYIDAPIKYGADKPGDAQLQAALARLAPDASLVVRSEAIVSHDYEFTGKDFHFPARDLAALAPVVISAWNANFIDFAKTSPYAVKAYGKTYPTLATALSGVHSGVQGSFAPDFLADPATVPTIREGALTKGDFPPGLLTGRTVIVSGNGGTPPIGFYGQGRVHPLTLDIAGASALTKPLAISFNAFPLLAFVWLLIRWGAKATRRRKVLFHVAAASAAFVVPIVLQLAGVTLDVCAALVAVMIYGIARLWQRRVRRVQHTSLSGLPNLLALSDQPIEVGRDVVVAVIARYEEIIATLPHDLHGECARQIARRLSVGSGIGTVYNGEGGHFAWTEEARPLEMQLNHLEGLRALFAAPLEIGSYKFDTNIHIGLDRNEGLDALTRVNSALASANDALGSGQPVELFEAERLAEASWELSLHARIDEGLRNGEIWLAYQTQWDMKTGQPTGIEALIRWNHPTRGPIAPDAFILQAERAGRIDALTYWVVEESISAALALNAIGQHLQMSFNLSAQMVDKPGLVSSLAEIVSRRGMDPRQMTIEVTETSSVRNRPAAVQNLTRLREMGFRLSIDDFGTGEASLAYLADLPSDELKLDRRFVSRILTHDRERKIVRSTIDLAHALDQHVVAEGIEDEATYRLLVKMGCDLGQGYYLARPQPFAELRDALLKTGHPRFGTG